MKRFILTGAPGAGKTTLIRALAGLGRAVVEEAATDVIADMQAEGLAEPWTHETFLVRIVELQRSRRLAPCGGGVQLHDRSAICTYALALHLGRPVPPALKAELEAIASEGVFERRVLFVRNIGFVEPTAARRISFEDSLAFEALHEQVYRELGYELVEIAAAPVETRVRQVLVAAT
ncbi:AAA family ATPase [Phenylobacterium sp.]|uniref:AAA family ATPase n=1 Tax=Phenylobacterium sp. TaxID=1871053 RepID=UPI0035B182FD